MGWSHGGYITLLSVFSDKHPFKAAARHGARHEPRVPAVVQGTRATSGDFSTQSAYSGVAVREAQSLHRAFAALSRGQTADPAARPCRDQRHGRRLRRGPADRRRPAREKAGPGRNEDLRRSRSWAGEWRPHVQPTRQHQDAGARRLARSAGLVESHVDVFRVESAAVPRIARKPRRRALHAEND